MNPVKLARIPAAVGDDDNTHRPRSNRARSRRHVAQRAACRCVRLLRQNEEVPLAHGREQLPRLSSLLDEQADQIFAATDAIAERVRKIGGTTIRSISHIARLQTIPDDDADAHSALAMLSALCADNQLFIAELRRVHVACDDAGEVATASLIENFIGESERRTWQTRPGSRRTARTCLPVRKSPQHSGAFHRRRWRFFRAHDAASETEGRKRCPDEFIVDKAVLFAKPPAVRLRRYRCASTA
jgi:hypothetical protein